MTAELRNQKCGEGSQDPQQRDEEGGSGPSVIGPTQQMLVMEDLRGGSRDHRWNGFLVGRGGTGKMPPEEQEEKYPGFSPFLPVFLPPAYPFGQSTWRLEGRGD